jgi:hypothetical protein
VTVIYSHYSMNVSEKLLKVSCVGHDVVVQDIELEKKIGSVAKT